MDRMSDYRVIIQRALETYASIPYAHGNLECEAVFDTAHDRYLLMTLGWDRGRRVHGCLVHIDLRDGYVWIQRDGTEDGIAPELVAAGIPKTQIVLGFQAPEFREHTDYAHIA